jgi:hypothetical protein
LYRGDPSLRGRPIDAPGAGNILTVFQDGLDGPPGRRNFLLSLGKVFLPGRCLNEFPNPGEDVKIFQVIGGELTGKKAGALHKGLLKVDDDQIPAQQLAAAAVNRYFIVGQALVADLDLLLSRKALQLLKKERVGKLVIHRTLPARQERGSRFEERGRKNNGR